MRAYGKKNNLKHSKVKCHSSDTCAICSNIGWKVSKRRERCNNKLKDNKNGGSSI